MRCKTGNWIIGFLVLVWTHRSRVTPACIHRFFSRSFSSVLCMNNIVFLYFYYFINNLNVRTTLEVYVGHIIIFLNCVKCMIRNGYWNKFILRHHHSYFFHVRVSPYNEIKYTCSSPVLHYEPTPRPPIRRGQSVLSCWFSVASEVSIVMSWTTSRPYFR